MSRSLLVVAAFQLINCRRRLGSIFPSRRRHEQHCGRQYLWNGGCRPAGAAVPQSQSPYYSYGDVPVFSSPQSGAAFSTRYNAGYGFNAFAPAYGGVVVNPTPWFAIPTVRQQLRFNAIQYQQLYNGYVDAYTRDNEAVAAIPVGMAIAEREGRLQVLEEAFNSDVNTAAEANVTDPQALQGFNELKLQHQNRPAQMPGFQPVLSLRPNNSAGWASWHINGTN